MTTILQKLKNTPRIDYINYLILLYAFTLSFPMGIAKFIAVILIIFWITDKNTTIKLPETKIFLLFGIFLLYCIISYTWSNASIKEAIFYIQRYWLFIPIYIIFKYLQKEKIKTALSVFIFGMSISEIFSYGNFFNIWRIGLGNPSDPTVFMSHSMYGLFLTVTALFLLFKLFYENRDKFWYLNLFFFLTLTTNIFVNSGRTGYMAFSLSLITTIIILNINNMKKMFKYIIISLAIIIVSISLAYNFSTNFKNRILIIKEDINKIIYKNSYSSSIGARISFWIITRDILDNNLFLGVGIGNQNNVKKQIIDEKYSSSMSYTRTLQHFHNSHLETLAQYGIIGYILFLLILVRILMLKIKNQIINSLKIILLASFFYSSMTIGVFYLPRSMILFTFILGIILVQYRIENDKKI